MAKAMMVDEVGFGETVEFCGCQVHVQGGTYEEMPLPVKLIIDRAPGFLTEPGMFSGICIVKRNQVGKL